MPLASVAPPELLWNTALISFPPCTNTSERVLATAFNVLGVSDSTPLYTWLAMVAFTSHGPPRLRLRSA